MLQKDSDQNRIYKLNSSTVIQILENSTKLMKKDYVRLCFCKSYLQDFCSNLKHKKACFLTRYEIKTSIGVRGQRLMDDRLSVDILGIKINSFAFHIRLLTFHGKILNGLAKKSLLDHGYGVVGFGGKF